MMLANTFTLLAVLGAVQAHMHLEFPPTLMGDNNPYTPEGKADYSLNYPYGCCGLEEKRFCKGHLDLLDQDEGRPTATWAAGQPANFTLSGRRINTAIDNPVGGTHAGGSCQASFSVDKGKTFKVVKTWNGNCPPHDNLSLDPVDQVFDFTVPADLPSGNAVFAWSWINREQEFNMNCASVTITGGDSDGPQEPEQPQEPEDDEEKDEKYTLEGCTCYCPQKSFGRGCQCYSCDSPRTNRRTVERKALTMHKRRVQRTGTLSAPHRRQDVVAFSARPDMAFNIDTPDGSCFSRGSPFELRFPDPGPDVEEKPGNDGYELVEPDCN